MLIFFPYIEKICFSLEYKYFIRINNINLNNLDHNDSINTFDLYQYNYLCNKVSSSQYRIYSFNTKFSSSFEYFNNLNEAKNILDKELREAGYLVLDNEEIA